MSDRTDAPTLALEVLDRADQGGGGGGIHSSTLDATVPRRIGASPISAHSALLARWGGAQPPAKPPTLRHSTDFGVQNWVVWREVGGLGVEEEREGGQATRMARSAMNCRPGKSTRTVPEWVPSTGSIVRFQVSMTSTFHSPSGSTMLRNRGRLKPK